MDTGETRMIVNPEIGTTISYSISPNGDMVALVEHGGTIHLINGNDGRVIETIETETNSPITNLDWSYDNELLAFSGLDEETVSIVDVQSGQRSTKISSPAFGRELKLAWSPNKGTLLIGDSNGSLFVYDAETAKILKRLDMYQSSVFDVEWSPDGRKVAAVGSRGEIYIWETGQWKREAILQSSTDYAIFADSVFSTEGDKIILMIFSVSSFDPATSKGYSSYQVWDIQSQEIINEWTGDEFCSGIAISQNGDLLASSTGEIWNTMTGEKVQTLSVSDDGGFLSMFGTPDIVWSPDGLYLIFPGDITNFFGIKP
jgi:WD40 repeat protein